MKILIDTNLFLDVILKRENYYKDSSKIWSLVSEKIMPGFISAISINNLFYILRKKVEIDIVEELIDQIMDEFEIVPLTKDILKKARTMKNKDYEDSIQYLSALQAGCDYLITRNKSDFSGKDILIIVPEEFIKIYFSAL